MSDLFSSMGDFKKVDTGFGLTTGNEMYNAGVNSWDSGYLAQQKVDEYRRKQSEQLFTPSADNSNGNFVSASPRKTYGLISGLNLARLITLVLIFAAGFYVYQFGVDRYGPRIPSEDGDLVFSRTLSENRSKQWIARWQPSNIEDFKNSYGALYREDAPFGDLFKGCKGASCAEADYYVVNNFRRYAKNQETYWNDFCAMHHALTFGKPRLSLPLQWSIQPLNVRNYPYSHKCVIDNFAQAKAAYSKEMGALSVKLGSIALLVIGLGLFVAIKAGIFKSRAESNE